jgi:hypothetical protein
MKNFMEKEAAFSPEEPTAQEKIEYSVPIIDSAEFEEDCRDPEWKNFLQGSEKVFDQLEQDGRAHYPPIEPIL